MLEDENLDKELLRELDFWLEKKSTKQITNNEAVKILDYIIRNGGYNQKLKNTVKHIRVHYEWTANADKKFRTIIRKLAKL